MPLYRNYQEISFNNLRNDDLSQDNALLNTMVILLFLPYYPYISSSSSITKQIQPSLALRQALLTGMFWHSMSQCWLNPNSAILLLHL